MASIHPLILRLKRITQRNQLLLWIFCFLSVASSLGFAHPAQLAQPGALSGPPRSSDPPEDLFGSGCRINRADLNGGGLSRSPFPLRQKLGNCYSEVAARMIDARAPLEHPRVSSYLLALLALKEKGTTALTQALVLGENSKRSWGRSIVDGGSASWLAARALSEQLCPAAEIEGKLERAAQGVWLSATDQEKRKEKWEAPEDVAHDLYRKAVNLIYLQAIHTKSGQARRAREELAQRWIDENLPIDLFPAAQRVDEILKTKSGKLRAPEAPFAFFMSSCARPIPALSSSSGKAKTIAPNGVVWKKIITEFESRVPLRDLYSLTVCSSGFTHPERVVSKNLRGCGDHSEHVVALIGSARCEKGQNWYLIQNSWGKNWCASAAGLPESGLLCDRRAGRNTGNLWVSQKWLDRFATAIGSITH